MRTYTLSTLVTLASLACSNAQAALKVMPLGDSITEFGCVGFAERRVRNMIANIELVASLPSWQATDCWSYRSRLRGKRNRFENLQWR